MTRRRKSLERILKSAGILFASLAFVSLAAAQQPDVAERSLPAAATPAPEDALSKELPDSPGATLANLQQPASPGTGSQQQSAAGATQAQTDQTQSSQTPQRPVGTAAAEPTHAAGVAASEPAGVAIAPAKQHRARTIVIRVGALIAAGVAVGTVVALTAATSSKPPGAH